VSKLKLAQGLLITLRGMPQIYSGDEIAMPGGEDPDNRHDFPGGFPGDARNAFTQAGRTAAEQEVFAWTSSLLKLRSMHPALQTGIEQNLLADEDAFAFVRSTDSSGCAADHSKERFLIVVNKAQRSKLIQISEEDTLLAGCAEFRAVAPAGGTIPMAGGEKLHVEAPAESMTVYEVR
jgi:glycosidase